MSLEWMNKDLEVVNTIKTRKLQYMPKTYAAPRKILYTTINNPG